MRTLIALAHRRNGGGGAPFDVVLFNDDDGTRMVAISFDDDSPEGAKHVAVFDVEKLAAGNIGPSAMHPGALYSRDVRGWIAEAKP